jgi:hypothetical protein
MSSQYADYEWVSCPVCSGKGEVVRRTEQVAPAAPVRPPKTTCLACGETLVWVVWYDHRAGNAPLPPAWHHTRWGDPHAPAPAQYDGTDLVSDAPLVASEILVADPQRDPGPIV